MEQINVSVLNWTTNPRLQYHRRRAAQGRKYKLPIPVGYIYPFQLSRPSSGLSISSFKVISDETGQAVEVISDIMATGLTITPGDGFDMIRYLGTVPLPGVWPEGLYYCRMSDGVTVWYSEYICMVQDVSDLIRIEWRHSSPIAYRDGILDYAYPLRNYVYLDADIGFPKWPVDQEVELRNGIPFPVRITTWKEYRFNLPIPEYLGDVFRMLRQHDDKKVFHLGREFVCEVLQLEGDPDWGISVGDVADAEFVFRTGTVVTTTAKPALPTPPANPSACVPVRYVVNSIITDLNSVGDDLATYGIVGDHIGINVVLNFGGGETGSFTVRQITHLSTNPQRTRLRDAVADDVIFDLTGEKYYVHTGEPRGFIFPGIYEDSEGTLTGFGIPGATAELWIRSEFGQFTRSGLTYTHAQLKAGISPPLDGVEAIRITFISASCGPLQDSEVFNLNAPDLIELTGYDYQRYNSSVYS